jgi:hypothetical protein
MMASNYNQMDAEIRTSVFNSLRLSNLVTDISKEVSDIFEISDSEIPKKIKRKLFSIVHYKNELLNQIENDPLDDISVFHILNILSERAQEMLRVANSEPLAQSLLKKLQKIYDIIFNEINLANIKQPRTIGEEKKSDISDVKKISSAVQILKNQLIAIQHETNKTRQDIAKAQDKAHRTDMQLSSYEERLNDTFKSSSDKMEVIISELHLKQNEVNELVGTISGATISGSYAKSADGERAMANMMRNGSVILMLIIVSIIGYSLFETAKPHFDWETALFRLLFSLALSVPAAYLARESSKHREQQYTYLRLSLDLQAITPYLASLPAEEQHRLKAELANRIFGAQEVPRNSIESYPLNLNDLLLAIFSKIDMSKKSSSDNEK